MNQNKQKEITTFYAQIAGVKLEIASRYPKAMEAFLGHYLQADIPAEDCLRIELGEEDIAIERELSQELLPGASEPMLEILALHRLLSEQLIDRNILLLHGSALALDKKAYIFTAPSGTGKSTHARLWREAFGEAVTMINDDKPYLKFTDTEILVCGSPWNGKHRLDSPIEVPLAGLCFLERGEENRIEPAVPGRYFPKIYTQIYHPETPERMLRTLQLADRLKKEVPLWHLFCRPDREAAEMAAAAMVYRRIQA